MSLRSKIRGLRSERITVLGEEVEVRGLSAAARVQLESQVDKGPDGEPDATDALVRTVIACTHNGRGPIFTADDIPWLKTEADGGAVAELFAAATRVNSLQGREKNSPPTPSAASPSA